MSIANEINRLNNAKAAIKQSIENKGVTVSDSALLDEYPALIDKIESGSSGGSDPFYETMWNIITNNNTDYSYLFENYYENLEGDSLDDIVSRLDTSKVTDMSYMFQSCIYLTSLDLSSFDTSNVTNMMYMFGVCNGLTSLDLSSFDTSNVTDMSYMFYSCRKLTTFIGELDLSNLTKGWNGDMYNSVFPTSTPIETLYLKNIYKNCTMTNASKWSIGLKNTVVKDECLVYIINELPDLINDKGLTATDKIVLTLPPTNTLTAEQVQVAIDKGWSVANTTY